MSTFLLILMIIIMIASIIGRNLITAKRAALFNDAEGKRSSMTPDQITAYVDSKMPQFISKWAIGAMAAIILGLGLVNMFDRIWFYAEPGYIYHVRDILGNESMVDGIGYSSKLFGRVTDWKKGMTVQAMVVDIDGDGKADILSTEEDGGVLSSATMPPQEVVMLDQVDSKVSATVRFHIPTKEEDFLKMAHDYRTPENLLRTALIPAFKETLQATGSLMGAEEYFNGRRTEFNAEFQNQMKDGIYMVIRKQVNVKDETAKQRATAAADLRTNQEDFGDSQKVKWVVERQRDEKGEFIRKKQNFDNYKITVVEARVTELDPNPKFKDRMVLKQQSAADRAVAQEKRVQEEEQKLLAIATGEREIAQMLAEARKDQATKTTNEETKKRMALIESSKVLEQAEIEKKTAQIQKEKADIDAERIKVLADADRYERESKIKGDNALDKKLSAIVQMNKDTMSALAQRQVPNTVVYQGTGGEGALGTDGDIRTVAQTQMLKNLKALDLDLGVTTK